MLNLKITPQRPALLKGFDNEFYALLQVNADDQASNNERSKSLNLAIIIDRSGSMSGQPLNEAKACAIMMVKRMHADDRIAVVTYDNEAKLVVPSTLCANKQEIISSIRMISEG